MRRQTSGFGYVSRAERRAADHFFAALTGRGLRRAPLALPPYAAGRELAEQQPGQTCGVFGPAGPVALTLVRNAVAAGARAERTAWHTSVGFPRVEDEVALFGRLVSYYLGTEPSIRRDHLLTLQAAARAFTTFGPLLAPGMTTGAITTEVVRIKLALLAAVTTPPAALDGKLDAALRVARQAHFDSDPWSGVFVSSVVRGAAIAMGLEALAAPTGSERLLKLSAGHLVYTREAWRRRQASVLGTYHAFGSAERQPEVGDIVVMDRRPSIKANEVTVVTAMPTGSLAGHGDIVVEVLPTHVVTVGGNVCNSVRFRHYPRNGAGFLEVSRHRLFVQENARGELAPLPVESCRDVTDPLDMQSTKRVFALLKLVEECRTPAPAPSGN
jgi:hypothetical protein